jgi:dipeptidyl aminopeptidase/acylaminoacyl peptidase
MKSTLLFFSMFFWTVFGKAQDGAIIEKTQLFLSDTIIRNIQKQDLELSTQLTNVNFYRIVYLSDSLKVVGYLSEPKQPGKYPCIIYNRGGIRNNSKLTLNGISQTLGRIASWGYVVFASQYRGNDGGEGKEEYGGSDVHDVLNLFATFSFLPNTDTARIGIYGVSRGGMMTYQAMKSSCRFKAAVVSSGITDVFVSLSRKDSTNIERMYKEIIPNYTAGKQETLKERSALYWTDKLCKTTPLLILQGSADVIAPPLTAIEFIKKLIEIKHPVRFMLFEGGQHTFAEY